MRDEDAQRKVDQIAAELATLTQQLNGFKPISEKNVGIVQKQVCDKSMNISIKQSVSTQWSCHSPLIPEGQSSPTTGHRGPHNS